MERTFKDQDELKQHLRDGEKWSPKVKTRFICSYDEEEDGPYRLGFDLDGVDASNIFDFCDGKTLWEKVDK